MSLLITGRRGVSAGASAPGQIATPLLLSDGTPGTLYSISGHPTNGSGPLTQVTGVLSPSGIAGVQTRFNSAHGDPLDAQTIRVDYYNVPAIAQTAIMRGEIGSTFGAYSPASNSVTPVAYSQVWTDGHDAHYCLCGDSTIDVSSLWSDGYFVFQWVRTVSPGDSTTAGPHYNAAFTPAMNAPAYPTGVGMTNQKMIEVTPQGSGGYGVLVNILLQNPALGTNGIFNANPYGRLGFYFYPTIAGSYSGGTETTYNVEDVLLSSAAAGGIQQDLAFANQDFATNTFPGGSTGQFDRTSIGAQGAYVSNTGTIIRTSSTSTFVNGDHILSQVGDQTTGGGFGDLAQWVTGPVPGVITLNTWNSVETPTGPTGLNMLAFNRGMHYKHGVAMPANPTGSVTYICKMAFIK